MGFRIRKSFNVGCGFRINISKSGIGYSWGVPGYRITKTADGKTRYTYSIPGTGISYVEEESGNKTNRSSKKDPHAIQLINGEMIESTDINNFQSVEYSAVISEIKKARDEYKQNKTLSKCLWLSWLFFPIFLIIGIIGSVGLSNFQKMTLDYNFEDDSYYRYSEYISAWKSLMNCNKLCQVRQKGISSNSRISAGINTVEASEPFKITTNLCPYLDTNVEFVTLEFTDQKLIILPDKFLIFRNDDLGVVDCRNVKYSIMAIAVVEPENAWGIPTDSEIIEYRWRFSNKDGSPDRRYKNNVQYPVYKHGQIHLTSPEGLNIVIQCSNERIVEQFRNTMFSLFSEERVPIDINERNMNRKSSTSSKNKNLDQGWDDLFGF